MSFLTAISELAKREALKLLEDEKFEFEADGFKGYVQAVKPGRHLNIKVEEFNLASDTLSLKVKVMGRFKAVGKLTPAGITFDMEAILDTDIFVEAQATLLIENNKFFVDPQVEDLALKIDVIDLSPPNLSNGKTVIAKIANTKFQVEKQNILKKINEELEKQALDI